VKGCGETGKFSGFESGGVWGAAVRRPYMSCGEVETAKSAQGRLTPLFGAEGDNWVYAGGAAGGHEARNEGGGG